jgi:hypothetical protein
LRQTSDPPSVNQAAKPSKKANFKSSINENNNYMEFEQTCLAHCSAEANTTGSGGAACEEAALARNELDDIDANRLADGACVGKVDKGRRREATLIEAPRCSATVSMQYE